MDNEGENSHTGRYYILYLLCFIVLQLSYFRKQPKNVKRAVMLVLYLCFTVSFTTNQTWLLTSMVITK